MRKISLVALFAALVAVNVNATDLWTGSRYVTWGQGLQIEASLFAGAKPGNALKVFYTNASDGIEFKANDVNIAGSRMNAWISGEGAYELYLTPGAIDAIKGDRWREFHGNKSGTERSRRSRRHDYHVERSLLG